MGEKWHSRLAWTVGLMVMVLLLVACAAPAAPTPTPSAKPAAQAPTPQPPQPTAAVKAAAPSPTLAPLSPPVTVRVAVYGSIGDGAIYIAQDKGYFKEQGLQVEMSVFGTTAESIPLLGSEKMEVTRGVGSAGLFNAIVRGIPLKIVADSGRTYKGSGYIAIVLQKELIDSGQVKGFSDLKGRKFAVAGAGTGSLFERLMHTALAKGSLSPKDASLSNFSMADAMSAMGSKSIDGAVLAEPLVTQGVERGLFVRWQGLDDLLPDEQHTWLIYAPSFAEKSPEAAKRFMVAYLKGARDYMDAIKLGKDKENVINVLVKYTSVKEPALFSKMIYPAVDPNGGIDKPSITRMIDWNTGQGYITGKLDINTMVDDQFLKFALGQIGESR